MTNADRVLSFVQEHPGHTQREISAILDIQREQRVNQILHKLINKDLLVRISQEGAFRYYKKSNTNYTKHPAGGIDNNPGVTTSKSAGDSSEQREAEIWLVEQLAAKLGIKLEKRRKPLNGGSWVELDGLSEAPLVLCEAWAHIGKPKTAQKWKIMMDAFKLLFVNSLYSKVGKRILIFSDQKAASHFQGKSWMAQCLRRIISPLK